MPFEALQPREIIAAIANARPRTRGATSRAPHRAAATPTRVAPKIGQRNRHSFRRNRHQFEHQSPRPRNQRPPSSSERKPPAERPSPRPPKHTPPRAAQGHCRAEPRADVASTVAPGGRTTHLRQTALTTDDTRHRAWRARQWPCASTAVHYPGEVTRALSPLALGTRGAIPR